MNTSTIVNLNGGTHPGAPPLRSASRMSLDNTEDGIIESPKRLLIAGAEKIGKSTFAAAAPSPIFMGTDRGTMHLNIKRLPSPDSFKETLEGLHEVESRGMAKGFRTLVIDPLNWFEAMFVSDVLGDSGKSLNAWGSGYGAGAQAVMDRWRTFLKAIERVWTAGMNVIITAHVHVKKFEDPEGPGYERYELAMAKEPAGLFKQWVDCILFVRQDAFGKIDPVTKKVKATGSNTRMIYTEKSPAYDAGNRWCLPPEIPLSWSAFNEAYTNGIARRNVLLAEIEVGLVELNDPEIAKKVHGWLFEPQADVVEIANAVAAKVGERRGAGVKEVEASHE